MLLRAALAVSFAALGLALGGAALAEPAPKPPSGGELGCAVVTAEARLYGYGYQHWVTLANHCQQSVSCEVWTNVDPTPHLTLTAKPGETASVATRLTSPSRELQAGKSCKLLASR
jgi:hypothetical protein